jgi:hypothetical protein
MVKAKRWIEGFCEIESGKIRESGPKHGECGIKTVFDFGFVSTRRGFYTLGSWRQRFA